MSLLLTLEQGPRTQAVSQARLDEGELVIGRSPDSDWQIDDPDMFISRAHCRITADHDGYVVTDISSSGLFIDGGVNPLGPGNSARLRNGMRLRLGDYVISVDLHTDAAAASWPPQPASRPSMGVGYDDFFSVKAEEELRPPRPADLPNPFEQPEPGAYQRASFGDRGSPAFDDPFSLDPVASPAAQAEFGDDGRDPDPFGFGTGGSSGNSRDAAFREPFFPGPVAPPAPQRRGAPASPDRGATGAAATPEAHRPFDATLRAAFLRGMGVDLSDHPEGDAVAEMEKFGRQYRLMLEGLMQLLRKRAEEKGNARVAQTVVGASDVNPLKFLPTVDDALATLLAERSPGFLNGEPAIVDAIRDLANHHVRAWRGIQGALRRMIDRFDPVAIEEELKSSSAIDTLLSGGRSAKLWELYRKRHREIAVSAESRFMGEIGADFRDAYEEE
ncbi:MAG TPA: type VI secretion system-associated FHA domain protein TagH [Rhizobiaceae bacterium]|nr:type VI secretion system-associated FHA domain protein TagH [Rhizobiaceae bacterium]